MILFTWIVCLIVAPVVFGILLVALLMAWIARDLLRGSPFE